VFLNFSSFHNVLKTMAFVSGGVQNDLDSKHFLRHSASSSWILPHLITSLSMQALAKSSSCDQ
jgi:zinc transporter ZupT